MTLLSWKSLDGGGNVVAWAREEEGSGDDLRVEVSYENQSKSKAEITSFKVGQICDSDDETCEYVIWDTVWEALEDLGVGSSATRSVVIESVYEGMEELFDRRHSTVLVLNIVVSKKSIKSLLVANGAMSLKKRWSESGGEGCWNCAICLDSSRDGDELGVGRLQCSHEFHVDCLIQSVIKSITASSSCCPLCRFKFLHFRS